MDVASSKRVAARGASGSPASPARLVLPGSHRLRSSRAFQRIYQAGATVGEQHLVLHVLELPDQAEPSLVGFAVSKRVGNAVVRNRVRRRLRELVRAELGGLRSGVQIVVAARPSAARATFPELAESMRRALSRARLGHV